MTFAEKLASLRKQKLKSDEQTTWTQQDLADESGVPVTTVRNHEQDHREPTLGHLYAYCKALGVSCDAFKDCVYRTAPKPTARNKKP